ncbi:MAG: S26 family signal peptidase [Gemmatimonadales bacterium]
MTNQAGLRAWVALAALVLAGFAGASRLRRLEVIGDSMLPTLQPGDRVVVWRGTRVRTGDLVAFPDPSPPHRVMVKRVSALLGEGRLLVEGDNRAVSIDSRSFGSLHREALIGRIVYRYAPESRSGRLVTRG